MNAPSSEADLSSWFGGHPGPQLGSWALLAVGILLAGCQQMELNSTSCSFGDGEAPGETAVLMEGYHYHWDQLSHRISYLKAGVGVPDDDGSAVGHLGLLGGPWSDGRRFVDLPSYGLGYAHLQSSEVTAWYGHVPLRIPSGGRIEEPVSVSLSDLALPQREHWLVALAGFCFDTDVPGEGDFNNGYDPVDGWAIKDLAVGISPALATESTVDFVAAAELRGGTIDRDNHNEAMLHAQVDADLADVERQVDQSDAIGGILRQQTRQVDGERGGAHSALGAQQGDHHSIIVGRVRLDGQRFEHSLQLVLITREHRHGPSTQPDSFAGDRDVLDAGQDHQVGFGGIVSNPSGQLQAHGAVGVYPQDRALRLGSDQLGEPFACIRAVQDHVHPPGEPSSQIE